MTRKCVETSYCYPSSPQAIALGVADTGGFVAKYVRDKDGFPVSPILLAKKAYATHKEAYDMAVELMGEWDVEPMRHHEEFEFAE